MSSTIDQKEVDKFSAMSDEWWDESSKFKALHNFNPVRISYIRSKIIDNFSLNKNTKTPFSGLDFLDVGCGGGLISEPFARMGANLTSIDPSKENIAVAKSHSEKSGLKIDYIATTSENLVSQTSMKFDVVLALEIIEHVADVNLFLESCFNLMKKNGLLFIATINRTYKSLLLAKIMAEYVINLVPRGTHSWQKFLKPSEINSQASRFNLNLQDLTGFKLDIIRNEWKITRDVDVNYVMLFSN
jgi:2-polyprenyl-6-hydroxyphenyl methylase/3-demethylubiquinone-9 3-methyltransferase